MDDITILGRDDGRDLARLVIASHGAPAFMRRAALVEAAYHELIERCQRRRDEWLLMVHVRLGLLGALAGEWTRLRPWLSDDDQPRVLQHLFETLQPRLRQRIEPTASERPLRRTLVALRETIECFNGRWQAFLPTVDLSRVNEARDGYNRYYVLEKECAVRSPKVARQGFQPLPPLTVDDLAAALPLLPVPGIRPG